MTLKPYIIQLSEEDPLNIPFLERVDYRALAQTLRYPLLWVYEGILNSWLPLEVDRAFINRVAYAADDRFNRRLELLGLNQEEQQPWAELNAEMRANGYVIVKNIFSKGVCKLMADYYFRQPETHDRWHDMPGIKRTSVNNSPLMRLAHQSTEQLAKAILGDIKTSYSFTSAYESGTVLPRHTDRPQCVYNASIMLSSDPSTADLKRWPLKLEINGVIHEAKLDVGDAVFYSGVKDPHWRDELPADINGVLGTFFHYVDSTFTGSLD